jgi:hypothetical protein
MKGVIETADQWRAVSLRPLTRPLVSGVIKTADQTIMSGVELTTAEQGIETADNWWALSLRLLTTGEW